MWKSCPSVDNENRCSEGLLASHLILLELTIKVPDSPRMKTVEVPKTVKTDEKGIYKWDLQADDRLAICGLN